VGDRISTKYTLVGLPAGSCGTVQSVFLTVHGVYDVLFEPAQARRVVFQSELTLIPPTRQAAEV
jgi:hypothetical protein